MKLQIQGQTLRFRVNEAELARLLVGESIINSTNLGGGVSFSQCLHLGRERAPMFDITHGEWRLSLPEGGMRDYVARLPCREALSFEMVKSDGSVVSLQFEVDVRDSLQVRGVQHRRQTAKTS